MMWLVDSVLDFLLPAPWWHAGIASVRSGEGARRKAFPSTSVTPGVYSVPVGLYKHTTSQILILVFQGASTSTSGIDGKGQNLFPVLLLLHHYSRTCFRTFSLSWSNLPSAFFQGQGLSVPLLLSEHVFKHTLLFFPVLPGVRQPVWVCIWHWQILMLIPKRCPRPNVTKTNHMGAPVLWAINRNFWTTVIDGAALTSPRSMKMHPDLLNSLILSWIPFLYNEIHFFGAWRHLGPLQWICHLCPCQLACQRDGGEWGPWKPEFSSKG